MNDTGHAEGHHEIQSAQRKANRRLRVQLEQKDIEINELQREVDALTALNKSQAERIRNLLKRVQDNKDTV